MSFTLPDLSACRGVLPGSSAFPTLAQFGLGPVASRATADRPGLWLPTQRNRFSGSLHIRSLLHTGRAPLSALFATRRPLRIRSPSFGRTGYCNVSNHTPAVSWIFSRAIFLLGCIYLLAILVSCLSSRRAPPSYKPLRLAVAW